MDSTIVALPYVYSNLKLLYSRLGGRWGTLRNNRNDDVSLIGSVFIGYGIRYSQIPKNNACRHLFSFHFTSD